MGLFGDASDKDNFRDLICRVSSCICLRLLTLVSKTLQEVSFPPDFGEDERSVSRKADVLFSRQAIRGGKCDYDSDRPSIDRQPSEERDTLQRIDRAPVTGAAAAVCFQAEP